MIWTHPRISLKDIGMAPPYRFRLSWIYRQLKQLHHAGPRKKASRILDSLAFQIAVPSTLLQMSLRIQWRISSRSLRKRRNMAYAKSFPRKVGKCRLSLIRRYVEVCPGVKPPRLIIAQAFRFKTRLQRLNSIEASSRAKLNFLEQLYQFHKQQGNARVVVPTINHKPLDLWLLRKEVTRMGGFDAVSHLTLTYVH